MQPGEGAAVPWSADPSSGDVSDAASSGTAVPSAVRYAGAPTLRLEADPSAPGWIVHVDDAGEGIPPECRERVFEPFVRLEGSRSRTTGGSGLGLSIVQRIAHLHGGTVHIDQSPAGGCRVSIHLPVAS